MFFVPEEKITGDCGFLNSHNLYHLIQLFKLFFSLETFLYYYYKLASICNAIASQLRSNL